MSNILGVYEFTEDNVDYRVVIYKGNKFHSHPSMRGFSEKDLQYHEDLYAAAVNWDYFKSISEQHHSIIMSVFAGEKEKYRVWPKQETREVSTGCQCPTQCLLATGHLPGCPDAPAPKKYSYM